MSSNTQRVWQIIKPHIPLIRFRKGADLHKTEVLSVSATSSSSPPIGSTPRGSGIDEELIPKRYQRKPISQQEMEIIERGGPDIL
ncbi:alpha-ketoglutarate dehydrogenase component 4-like [Oppia nitens]|uniref:alpha-ketoglutarate dehydrogenase component 4-like n=1 Tax=Oppia nitens TaxID=1686743 RepID=UPI0023DCC028|nr:alpha-ketoglutarate dehydrogenase component 4-like [Oppia nitens]XP_054160304.1 alpha-ketoglutarate dehydrogenase component 4-like [Oppia nitens]XP_054160305.1 alpha-ketoglutarate dehydrogenase component 4-like [Oppia nitens]